MKRNVITLSIASCLVILALSSALLADVVGGYILGTYEVQAHKSHYFTVWLEGDETAMVEVEGDGGTDLDILLRDDSGRVVDQDTESGDYCAILFEPSRTARYTIEVRNLGDVSNRYDFYAD